MRPAIILILMNCAVWNKLEVYLILTVVGYTVGSLLGYWAWKYIHLK